MNAHTPGPWHIGKLALIGLGLIEIGDNKHTKRQVILDCRDYSDRMDEFFANARLIAASPELFEVLKKILEYHERGVKRNTPILSNYYLNLIKQVIATVEEIK